MNRPKAAPQVILKKNESPEAAAGESLDFQSSAQSLDEAQAFMNEVLTELDFVKHQEKKMGLAEVEQSSNRETLKAAMPKPQLSIGGDQLLGILGHCSLPGHIAHFYNTQSEIERHIKSVNDLGHERFVEAYNYLKANPSTEAIFVYESKMVAANRVNGRLIQKNIIAA